MVVRSQGSGVRGQESGVACSVYVKKVAKWHVDTNRFLFSYDPHELASWVKKIVNLTGCAGDFTLGRQHLTVHFIATLTRIHLTEPPSSVDALTSK
jgi:hypothetical protein